MEGWQKHSKWKAVWLHVIETYTGRKRSTQPSIPGVNTVTPAGSLNCYLHFPLSSLVYYRLFFFYNRHYLCNMRNKIKKFNQKQKHTIGGLGFCLDNLPTPRCMTLPDTHLLSPGQTWQQPHLVRSITGKLKPLPQPQSLSSKSLFASYEPNLTGLQSMGGGGVLLLKKNKCNFETNAIEPQMHTDWER